MPDSSWEKIAIGNKPDVLITFAGYKLNLAASHAWAVALAGAMADAPSKIGVGTAFAVVGPVSGNPNVDAKSLVGALDPWFVTSVVDALIPWLAPDVPPRIYVVTHSSGYTNTRPFLTLLLANAFAASAKRLVYYNVDGGDDDLAGTIAKDKKKASLFSRAYAVSGSVARSKEKPFPSRNYGDMVNLGKVFKDNKLGGFVDLDLGETLNQTKGKDKWPLDSNILHMSLINPANPLWYGPSKDDKEYAAKMERVKRYPAFYGGDLNPTYKSCTKDTVNADYFNPGLLPK